MNSLNEHIRLLKEKSTRRLEIVKRLASTNWGADKSTLRQLYIGYVRSVLESNLPLQAICSDTTLKVQIKQNLRHSILYQVERDQHLQLHVEQMLILSPQGYEEKEQSSKWLSDLKDQIKTSTTLSCRRNRSIYCNTCIFRAHLFFAILQFELHSQKKCMITKFSMLNFYRFRALFSTFICIFSKGGGIRKAL